jgi:hypothetical protein
VEEKMKNLNKLALERKLNVIDNLMGGETMFILGMNKKGKLELISAERRLKMKEKEDIMELEEPDYIG